MLYQFELSKKIEGKCYANVLVEASTVNEARDIIENFSERELEKLVGFWADGPTKVVGNIQVERHIPEIKLSQLNNH